MKENYIIPTTRLFLVAPCRTLCDSITSNSIYNYNVRDAGSEDINILWED